MALRERVLHAARISLSDQQVDEISQLFYAQYFIELCRHFQCQPASIDAKDFSPQLRKRFFWGNIPGLYTIPKSAVMDGESGAMTLDMALMPNSGRQAATCKVRTLTTNTNSLLQGRKENCSNQQQMQSLFPVLWTTNDHQSDIDSGSDDEDDELVSSLLNRGKKRRVEQSMKTILESDIHAVSLARQNSHQQLCAN